MARRLTDGRGVDLVVDSVGTTLEGSLHCLAYRGRITRRRRRPRPAAPRHVGAQAGNQSITGVFLGAELIMGDRAHAKIARLLDVVADGRARVVVDRTFPLAEAAAAHAYIESRKAFGRVVLVP